MVSGRQECRMKNIIIACNMIRDEVEKAMKETNCSYPIIWVDDTLHMYPSKLKDQLEFELEELDRKAGAVPYDNVLFAFGYCGNCFIGIDSGRSNLIIPRINDCTEMLLKGVVSDSGRKGCYYLTRGWMEGEKAIGKEYDFYIQRYGEKRAKRIMEVLLANYKSLMLIDTGAYDFEEYRPQAMTLAERLGLGFETKTGSIHILRKLFSGDWDEEFCIIPPHIQINLNHFGENNFTTSMQGRAPE